MALRKQTPLIKRNFTIRFPHVSESKLFVNLAKQVERNQKLT